MINLPPLLLSALSVNGPRSLGLRISSLGTSRAIPALFPTIEVALAQFLVGTLPVLVLAGGRRVYHRLASHGGGGVLVTHWALVAPVSIGYISFRRGGLRR